MHYTSISPEFVQHFFNLIGAATRVVITGHRSPDGDSIGSMLAMYHIVTHRFPDKTVIMPYTGERDTRFESFKYFDKVEFMPDMADAVEESDTLIVVDGSQLHRFTFNPEKLATVATRICIDHHASQVDDFSLSMVVAHAPANAEVIYRLFCTDQIIAKDVAELFLLGILTDTNNFSFLTPDQTDTLLIGKKLLDIAGVEIQDFERRYSTLSARQFALLKELIKNTDFGSAAGWPDFQCSFIGRDFVHQGEFADSEISMASGTYADTFLRKIQGHTWGFSVTPRSNGDVSVSSRSLPGSVNVRQFMERLCKGGGHDRAAGGSYKNAQPEEVVATITAWIAQNQPINSPE